MWRMVARKHIASLAIIVTALITISCGGKTTTKSTELPYQGIEATIRTDSVTEVLVELGDVPYSALATNQPLEIPTLLQKHSLT